MRTSDNLLTISQATRFWKYVDKNGPIPEHRPELGPCWVWRGAKQSHGYGSFTIKTGHTTQTHRLAYQQINEVPPGTELDHLCRNYACVRPSHLEAVTHQENLRRTQKTRCIHGHSLQGKNVIIRRSGRRECRACHYKAMKRYRNANKEEKAEAVKS